MVNSGNLLYPGKVEKSSWTVSKQSTLELAAFYRAEDSFVDQYVEISVQEHPPVRLQFLKAFDDDDSKSGMSGGDADDDDNNNDNNKNKNGGDAEYYYDG